jgi:DNA repair protein RecO (recombination protein O)
MGRNFAYSALTLRVKASGEANREAWFLTAEEGMVRATVFGGPKSRLRSQVAPFHEGRLLIYHDPVRDSRKVSDFDVRSYRTGIHELYERAMAAAGLAETILSSQGGGGNWREAAKLASVSLDALDSADAAACSRIAVYFFWHWARILGAAIDLSVCASCACEAGRDEVLWYNQREEALFCEKCAAGSATRFATSFAKRDGAEGRLRVESGGRLWLKAIEALPPAALAGVSGDKWAVNGSSLEQAKALSKAVLGAALGKRLPTWDGI